MEEKLKKLQDWVETLSGEAKEKGEALLEYANSAGDKIASVDFGGDGKPDLTNAKEFVAGLPDKAKESASWLKEKGQIVYAEAKGGMGGFMESIGDFFSNNTSGMFGAVGGLLLAGLLGMEGLPMLLLAAVAFFAGSAINDKNGVFNNLFNSGDNKNKDDHSDDPNKSKQPAKDISVAVESATVLESGKNKLVTMTANVSDKDEAGKVTKTDYVMSGKVEDTDLLITGLRVGNEEKKLKEPLKLEGVVDKDGNINNQQVAVALKDVLGKNDFNINNLVDRGTEKTEKAQTADGREVKVGPLRGFTSRNDLTMLSVLFTDEKDRNNKDSYVVGGAVDGNDFVISRVTRTNKGSSAPIEILDPPLRLQGVVGEDNKLDYAQIAEKLKVTADTLSAKSKSGTERGSGNETLGGLTPDTKSTGEKQQREIGQ